MPIPKSKILFSSFVRCAGWAISASAALQCYRASHADWTRQQIVEAFADRVGLNPLLIYLQAEPFQEARSAFSRQPTLRSFCQPS